MNLPKLLAAIPPKNRTAVAALVIGTAACGLRASLAYMTDVDALYLFGLLSMLADAQLYYLLLLLAWSAESAGRRLTVYGLPVVCLAFAESGFDFYSDRRELTLNAVKLLLWQIPPALSLWLLRLAGGWRIAPPHAERRFAIRDLLLLTFIVAGFLGGWRLVRQWNGDALLPATYEISDAAVGFSFAFAAAVTAWIVFRTGRRVGVGLLTLLAGLQLAILISLDAWSGLATLSVLLRGRAFNLLLLNITHVLISLGAFTLYFLYLRRCGEQLLSGRERGTEVPSR